MGGDYYPPRPRVESYPTFVQGPIGQQIGSIYRDRLRIFIGDGQYAAFNLPSKYYEAICDDEDHVKLFVYSVPDLERPSFEQAVKHEFKPTKRGSWFGPSWSTHWFRIHLMVPKELTEKEHLEFHWDAGNEGTVWTEDGKPLQGLTGGERIEWIIPDNFRDGNEHVFYIEMACNGMFGNANGDSIQPPSPDRYFNLHTARITAVNLQARALYYDFWMISDAAREFPDDSWQRHEAQQIGNAIMNIFVANRGSQESIIEGRKIAQKYLGDKIDSAKVYDSEKEPIVHGIGHCHIDTCWLWPWAETHRKIVRSWSNQCDLMERYPELNFACSQAQQFKWLKQDYPYAFNRVKSWIEKGRFHPIGGSWVEHDTNMPSGESLSRQFLYGQRFFESNFGKRSTTFWLPDTFGYSTQLPQVCRLSGMNRFFTQKLSWNNINSFPHTTFNWVALDGSQVLCHMTPAETYTASAHFGDIRRSITQHKSLNQDNTSILVFGKGDGGGGPTFEHLEKLRRLRGMADKTDLLPRVKMGGSVDDFFQQLEEKVKNGTKFPTWYGELYLELHRGTYTSQAYNKFNNRRSEFLLRDIELLATFASLKDSKYKYPKADIDEMWENVLLCQFHDCLPGSCIEMCYDDSDKLYAKVFALGLKLRDDTLRSLGFPSSPSNENFIAINTLPWTRSEIVNMNDNASAPHYALASGDMGILTLKTLGTTAQVSVQELEEGVFYLSNKKLALKVCNGAVTSLFDLENGREVIAKGSEGNKLVIFDDKPLYWQAWDVEVYHLDTRKELFSGNSRIILASPHRVSVETVTQISESSWIKNTISLSAATDAPSYVEFDMEVEWRENMKFLKVEFPVDITNTEASYETQYGIIRRPIHYNTSWDMSKFEICSHKWADLSEYNYGVSILNDSKYGFATAGNVMRLSLLRAPKAPDAHADMGRHHIRYAILPHAGPLDHRTVRAGYNFNNPLILQNLPASRMSMVDAEATKSLFQSISIKGAPALIIDTIKRGEDDEDVSRGELAVRPRRSVIVRLYDSLGGKTKAKLMTSLPVKNVYKCNLLEDDLEELIVERGVDTTEGQLKKGKFEVDIEVRAFEVATYRLQL